MRATINRKSLFVEIPSLSRLEPMGMADVGPSFPCAFSSSCCFDPEEGGNVPLRNVGILTALHEVATPKRGPL
jgi:hypothetical protein